MLTLLVLALASRALAGGAGGEYAVDVHDGEPFDDDATPNARASEYAPAEEETHEEETHVCLLYTSPSPRDQRGSRMPSSA